ncbi:hypothetical protein IFM58399_05103 [Aspergillus lentulus]|uniref:Uncharacterized protein n=1 Tax=Aspergillus lentulus TaxID=293939 RepID=A0ABQ0ZUN3_ASPLE|nr:uncharacterized protein IFM58399_05103 [Aspergillus lentulus]KAF4186226.1 hypothetical protein CNMCM7927_005714 [Aspergillus lentulus]GFF38055.1 hypothetical protein IFM58399_05103 [Aspergillus lentulus]GFF46057.1 hypothetical protein IFM62136_00409 [Aspergillus lentulus]GFF63953.1 hypothetical protein IFM47457_00539 [Aspergillus lentulus]GFF65300.1 hypothetical protein IFM60648_01538 [Aspergillus lentulus]
MKYKSPAVEDYETDGTPVPVAEKRKRDHKVQETSDRDDSEQPPNKVSKPTSENSSSKEGNKADPNSDSEEWNNGNKGKEDPEMDEDVKKGNQNEEGGLESPEGQFEDEQHAKPSESPKVHKIIEEFGRQPLEGTSLAKEPLTASPETVLAMVLDAMLKSRPISHDLSQRAVDKLIDEGYHDIRRLGESSWEERTKVLQDGGYNRYREQGATNLGDLADFVNGQYDGDLNNLLRKAGNDRKKTRDLIKAIKGLGDLGVDLFLNNVQSVWPSMAPFLDARSLKTAEELGIGTDLEAIYESLNRDPMRMSRLANGLSHVRLDKKQREVKEV